MGGSSSSESSSGDERRKKKKEHKKKEKKERKREKKEKKKRERKGGGAGAPPAGVEPCSEDDYFRRTAEFQRWLQESRGQFLQEMPSEESRRLFSKFASKWNGGELASHLYNATSAASGNQRTRHTWAFANSLSAAEQLQLESTRDSIQAQTGRAAGQNRDQAALARVAGAKRQREEPGRAVDEAAAALGISTRHDAGSRDALLAKRAAQTAFHRRREDEDTGPALNDRVLLGGGAADDLAPRLAKRHEASARRADASSARVRELEAKEAERMANFKRQMGLP